MSRSREAETESDAAVVAKTGVVRHDKTNAAHTTHDNTAILFKYILYILRISRIFSGVIENLPGTSSFFAYNTPANP
jgi:hypothetical protein